MTPRLSALAFLIAFGCALAPASGATPATGKTLQKTDTVVGKGSMAITGSTVTMHYTGWLFAPASPHQHGARIDSSEPGKPFIFKLGDSKVIKGWSEGMRGMKAGGKRTLIVPAEMAFGKAGFGAVPPTSNLIFDIELISVK